MWICTQCFFTIRLSKFLISVFEQVLNVTISACELFWVICWVQAIDCWQAFVLTILSIENQDWKFSLFQAEELSIRLITETDSTNSDTDEIKLILL